jgi:hypothetical protein
MGIIHIMCGQGDSDVGMDVNNQKKNEKNASEMSICPGDGGMTGTMAY